MARRIAKRRAAGAFLDRLVLFAILGDLVHLFENFGRLAGRSLKRRLREDPAVRHAAMAIGEAHVRSRQDMNVAIEIDGPRPGEAVLGLAAMRAGIHAQRPADRTRNAAIERQAANARFRRRTRHLDVGDRRTGGELAAGLDLDLTEAAPETNDDARHAAVAHQQVRAETDDVDRDAVG